MPIITMEEYEEFPVLPAESIVFLKVDSLEVKDVTGNKGSWQKLEFAFKLLGIQATGDGSPIENYDALITRRIFGSVPFRFNDSPENRLKQWVEAILAMELSKGFELDTDLLVDRKVRGITSTYEKKTTDPRTGRPFKNHQIESLLPNQGQVLTSQAASPAPAAIGAWGAPPAGAGWADDPPFHHRPDPSEFGFTLS
jgi:hypothetical protein